MASLSLNGTVIPPPCPSHIQKALQHALISKEKLLDKEINPVAYFMFLLKPMMLCFMRPFGKNDV